MTRQHQPNLFITGNSSGLGRALTADFLNRGWRVYGLSRRGCPLTGDVSDIRCDLTDLDAVPGAISRLLAGVERLDLVILNAGILGELRELHRTSLDEVRRLMDVNVWANKLVMDWLHDHVSAIEQIVMISSGAAVMGNRGWAGYAISKSALNMLARLYAHEFPETHITAFAPGLIDTRMMDYLCEDVDPDVFPAVQRLRAARGTDVMPDPARAAERVVSVLEPLRDYPTGSYVDIRQIIAPEEYAAFLKASAAGGSAPPPPPAAPIPRTEGPRS